MLQELGITHQWPNEINLRLIFTSYDKNKDGVLQAKEVKNFLHGINKRFHKIDCIDVVNLYIDSCKKLFKDKDVKELENNPVYQ